MPTTHTFLHIVRFLYLSRVLDSNQCLYLNTPLCICWYQVGVALFALCLPYYTNTTCMGELVSHFYLLRNYVSSFIQFKIFSCSTLQNLKLINDTLNERNVVDTITAKTYNATQAYNCKPCWCSKRNQTQEPTVRTEPVIHATI